MSDALVKKEQDIDSDDEEELELQRKADSEAAVKADEPEEDTSLANSDVTTKYQEAAKITQAALVEVAAMVRTILRTILRTFHRHILCSNKLSIVKRVACSYHRRRLEYWS